MKIVELEENRCEIFHQLICAEGAIRDFLRGPNSEIHFKLINKLKRVMGNQL